MEPIRQERIQFGTDLANIQTVEGKKSAGPAQFAAIASAAQDGYGMWAQSKAYKDMFNVTKQLDSDIADIGAGRDISSRLSSELSELSKNEPALKELASKLDTLDLGAKQHQQAKLLFTLRSEQAMKKAVSRAPGLRNEISQIASNTLGFDPSAATIKLLLRGIDSEWAEMNSGSAEKIDVTEKKRVHEELLKRNVVADLGSTPEEMEHNYGPNKRKLDEIMKLETQQQSIAANLASGVIDEKEALASTTRLATLQYGTRLESVNAIINNIIPRIKTYEDFKLVQEEWIPQLSALKSQMSQSISSLYDSLNFSDELRVDAQKHRDILIENATAGLEAILASDNITEFQTKATVLKNLQSSLNLDWSEANVTLATLNSAMPGGASSVYQVLLTSKPDLGDSLKDSVRQGFMSADPETRMKMNLNGFLSTIVDSKAFENLSQEQKANTLYLSLLSVEQANKDFADDPNRFSAQDIDSLSNAYATALQLSSQMPGEYWDKVSTQAATPLFRKMVDQLSTSKNPDDNWKAEILSDSAIEAANRYMEKALGTYASNATKFKDVGIKDLVYDRSTGRFNYTEPEISDLNIYKGSTGGAVKIGNYYSAKGNMKAFINAFDENLTTIDTYKNHDEKLRGLTKEQLIEVVAVPKLRAMGITIVGDAPEMPEYVKVEKPEDIKMEDLIRDVTRQIEELKVASGSLKGTEAFSMIERTLDLLTAQRRQLQHDKSAVEGEMYKARLQ